MVGSKGPRPMVPTFKRADIQTFYCVCTHTPRRALGCFPTACGPPPVPRPLDPFASVTPPTSTRAPMAMWRLVMRPGGGGKGQSALGTVTSNRDPIAASAPSRILTDLRDHIRRSGDSDRRDGGGGPHAPPTGAPSPAAELLDAAGAPEGLEAAPPRRAACTSMPHPCKVGGGGAARIGGSLPPSRPSPLAIGLSSRRTDRPDAH